jgi:putative protease
MKMGTTHFSLLENDVDVNLDGGLNLPPSAINALRREAAERLSSQKRELQESDFISTKLRKKSEKLNTALFLNAREFEKYKNGDSYFDICFLPIEYFENRESVSSSLGVYIPPVIFDGERERVFELLKKAEKAGAKHALITNLSNIKLLSDFNFEITADFRINISNSESARELMSLSIERFILHPEITLPMARDIGGGVIVYGRIPLMLTERCFIKENYGCDKCNSAVLTDRRGAHFPLMCEFGHRNLILNSTVTYMGDKQNELIAAGLYHKHFIFSTESAREIESVVSSFKRGATYKNGQIRRIGIVR